jgi:peptidoglycan/LPS O-acetylase OafA/YrhL/lysophospholipase L1-like esterase
VSRGVSRVRAQIGPTRSRQAVTHPNERPSQDPSEHAGQRQAGRAQRPASQPATARAPGLDGVRALAVLTVLAFHEQFSAFPGGFLGVDVFFVLSGYLITDLLVAQWDRRGRLDLRSFWVRRARRLLPALAVVLVTVTAAVAVIEPAQLGALRPALVAAVTYSSNWWQAAQHQSYFAGFGPPPPLQHLWSLAIEEQFYLVWPLILVTVLLTGPSQRLRAAVAWLGAVASAVAMAVMYVPDADPSWVYYGTDTHASALLIGAALALTWPLRRLRTATRDNVARADIAGLAGIAVLAWAMGHFSGSDPALYPAGLFVAALAAGGLVLAAATPGSVSRMLSWNPLRWLGLRSYGIYLWHWPVIALAAAVAGPGSTGVGLWLIETVTAITLAAASWRWIEEPIIRNGFRATVVARYRVVADSAASARRSPGRAFPAVFMAVALSVVGTAGYGVLDAPSSAGLQQQITHGAKVSGATPAKRVTAERAARRRAAQRAAAVRIPGSKVTAIGDSVMLASAPQLAQALPGISINAQVSRQMGAGLGVVASLADSGGLRRVVVVGLGTNGTVTAGQIIQLIAMIGPHRRLVLINTFVPRPWQDSDNQVLAAAARQHANVVLANWYATIEYHTSLLWSDMVHPRPAGAPLYAQMVASAVQATRNIRAGKTPWPPPVRVPSARLGQAG